MGSRQSPMQERARRRDRPKPGKVPVLPQCECGTARSRPVTGAPQGPSCCANIKAATEETFIGGQNEDRSSTKEGVPPVQYSPIPAKAQSPIVPAWCLAPPPPRSLTCAAERHQAAPQGKGENWNGAMQARHGSEMARSCWLDQGYHQPLSLLRSTVCPQTAAQTVL